MPAYKDENNNSWYCQFYFMDWQGNRKKKLKRGFQTKKLAKEWENEFLRTANAEMDMTLGSFVEVYFRDKSGELKERSIKNKRYMITAHLLPYFADKKMNAISPSDIIQWQNIIREKKFSESYLRMIQNQITALFTHAQRIYNLGNNPCKRVKKMGSSKSGNVEFWTKDEFDIFVKSMSKDDMYYTLFEVLFWTGCRIGEALALTRKDINFTTNQLNINKTYYRMDKQDIITTPKTERSVRTINIPQFLVEELQEYIGKQYALTDDTRLFPVVAEAVQHKLSRQIIKADIKRIRVHDVRHSHVAFLIFKGVEPLAIKERLGHESIKTTLNIYGHLYPNKQQEIAEMLNDEKQLE